MDMRSGNLANVFEIFLGAPNNYSSTFDYLGWIALVKISRQGTVSNYSFIALKMKLYTFAPY